MRPLRFLLVLLTAPLLAAPAGPRVCLSMTGLGPVRAGMTVDEVLPLLDWSLRPRKRPAEDCWYLRYEGPAAFRLMIIANRVVRIELAGPTTLTTFAGAGIGTREDELRRLYGERLDVQPHKYVEGGHTITLRSGAGTEGLRFETANGAVTALQAGPWEHLNYVEGCS
ncbi:MAG TPA: hypothetical protein VMF52_14700 [Steroidobacteraceae bacterium]|nr:hypothetical protein [Steroidobacteraceae bacterium]